MAENQPPQSLADTIRDARERLGAELRAQAEHILKLSQGLSDLQLLHGRTEQEAARQWDELSLAADANAEAASASAASAAANAAAAAEPKISPDAALENVLAAVRGLTSCTMPEQLFESVTEEASHWGVRAAIFDVRGKAAWGASAHGFGPGLTERVMRSLIVQINQSTPFKQVVETAGPVDASADSLKKNRNLLDKLKPAPQAPILLLPIRSAGEVSAIFYTDTGSSGQALPANALKILAEFAGAQIDRLIALSGGAAEESAEVTESAEPGAVVEEAVAEVAPPEPVSAESAVLEVATGPAQVEAASEAPVAEAVPEPPPVEAHVEEPVPAEAAPAVEAPPVEAPAETPAMPEPIAETKAVEAPPEPEAVAAPISEPAPESVAPPPPHEPTVEIAALDEAYAAAAPEAPAEAAPPVSEVKASEVEAVPPVEVAPVEVPPPAVVESAPPPAPSAFDISQLSESDQKVHKDAKRFARILVSEIELYNKTKVVEGRKSGDLYKRLKSDVDRSRQTYEKRFGKVLSKQFDYFHDELVKTLALNDAALLGPDYPGSTA